ncbi:MAG: lipopolysaccharide kinase InaA family protein [Acidiferrobacterales bacterium]
MYLADRDGAGSEIKCLQPVRVVPNKRASYLARWNEKEVFVKLFFDPRHGHRHWCREKESIKALAARGLLSPTLLHAGAVRDPKGYVLIVEALLDAETFADRWRSVIREEERQRLARMLVETLAAQHEAGILQRDLHLGNFLIAGSNIYSIDASKMRVSGRAVPKRAALRNLGLLLAQFDPRHDQYASAVLANYTAHRRWPVSDDDAPFLRTCVNSAREKRKRKFLAKIFRECTAFAVKKAGNVVRVYDMHYSSSGFHKFYSDPDGFFSGDDIQYLKQGNTSTVVRISVDGTDIVIKRYNIKGAWHGIKRALQSTRASISWRNAHLLQFYGVPTPRPVAYIEKRFGPIRRRSYFVCEYVKGTNYREYFADYAVSAKCRERIAQQIAEMLAILARYRIKHGDMKATNLIIANSRTYLTDLDAMREYRTALCFHSAHNRDIKRFLENWTNQQEIRNLFKEKITALA